MADDLVTFRHRLATRRAAGQPFDAAWGAELAALPDRRGLDYALGSCRSAWRRVYENAPQTAVDRAAARLALALEAEEAPLLQPRREAPPPRISITAPTAAGAAAAEDFRCRAWWKGRGAA